ncbi:MAG: hypothetical protein K0R57_3879 [Paenibacillaceae bacterium]|jgi:hypothetical protein|nr:hypothetical protein [Paenibacillaceae bacterium]
MRRHTTLKGRTRFLIGYRPADVDRELARTHKLNEAVLTALSEERLEFSRLYMEKWALQDDLRELLAQALEEEQLLLKNRESL